MRKLYTDVSLETPLMVTYNDVQTQACANDEDTVTIGATEYIRLTDENGHNVKAVIPNTDSNARQLIVRLNEGDAGDLCYIEGTGAEAAAMSTSIQVIDVAPEPTYTIDYFGNHQGGLSYDTLPYESEISPNWRWDMRFDLDTSNLSGWADEISAIISMNPQIALLTCRQGTVKINGTTVGTVDFDPSEIRTYVSELTISSSGNYTIVIHNNETSEDTTLTGTVSGDISGIVAGLTPAQVAQNLMYSPNDLGISAVLNIYS